MLELDVYQVADGTKIPIISDFVEVKRGKAPGDQINCHVTKSDWHPGEYQMKLDADNLILDSCASVSGCCS